MTRDLTSYTPCRFSSSMSNSQLKCPTHVQLDTRERHLPVLIPGGRFEELPGVAHNLWVTDRAVTPRQIREVLKSAQGSTSCGNAASNLANQP